jgi:hypothetical protein
VKMTVFPPTGAAWYGGSKAARTSWAQHDTALGYGVGDVGATTPPARRRRRGAWLQLLGGDAGLLGGGGVGSPPASSGLQHNKKKTPRGHLDKGAAANAPRCSTSLRPPLPSFSSLLAVSREEFPAGGGARKGGACRWIYRRRLSKVWAPNEWRMRLLGRVAGIAGQQCGGGGGHGGAHASSSAPTQCVTGRKTERNRDGEKGLTGGPHM